MSDFAGSDRCTDAAGSDRCTDASDAARLLGATGALSPCGTLLALSPIYYRCRDAHGVQNECAVSVRLLDAAGAPLVLARHLAAPPPGAVGEVNASLASRDTSSGAVALRNKDRCTVLIRAGKNIGKANATNVATQAVKEAVSRWNKEIKAAANLVASYPPATYDQLLPYCSPALLAAIGAVHTKRELALVPSEGTPASTCTGTSKSTCTGAPASTCTGTPASTFTSAPASTCTGTSKSTGTPASTRTGTPVSTFTSAPVDAITRAPVSTFTSAPVDASTCKSSGPPAIASAQLASHQRPPPMLVKNLSEKGVASLQAVDFAEGVTVQPKYNGVRCVAYLAGDSVALYSRNCETYPTPAHLVAPLRALLTALPIEPDMGPVYLDGELYRHGDALGEIVGHARRAKGAANDYYVYDVFCHSATRAFPSRDRQAALDRMYAAAGGLAALKVVRRAPNHPAANLDEVKAHAQRFIAEGYEGGIARRDGRPYESCTGGYHSSHLLKIKPTFDDEFPIVGYTLAGRGTSEGAVIWTCSVPSSGERFDVVPMLDIASRKYLGRVLGEATASGKSLFEERVRGLPLTVRYAELAVKTGKPLQARGVAVRSYEAAEDPIAIILAGSR